MPAEKTKWRSPKQWYDEEYRARSVWDHSYRVGADQGFAIVLLGSSFVFRYWTSGRWEWPTWNDLLVSLPFMLIGAAILLRYRSAGYKRKEACRWGLHDGRVERIDSEGEVRFRATCRCGWSGSVCESEAEADFQHTEHMLREDRIRESDAPPAQP